MQVQWVTRLNDQSIVKYGTNSGSYPFSSIGTTATYSVGLDGIVVDIMVHSFLFFSSSFLLSLFEY
jgi:hypothetical protein